MEGRVMRFSSSWKHMESYAEGMFLLLVFSDGV